MNRNPLICLAVALSFSGFADITLSAAILGTNPPALPLSLQRVATLPNEQQAVWMEYLQRSAHQRQADQDFLRAEMREQGAKQFMVPPEVKSKAWMALDKVPAWYKSVEARRTADCIVSFQTPAGGWGKNTDMSGRPRSPGMLFATENGSRHLSNTDFDIPIEVSWSYVGTFDNDATISQLRYLAKVISEVQTNESVRYRATFLHGLDYVVAAQYPNGGWPQVWPLSGGYHDSITFNDNAMVNVLSFLRDVSAGTNEFGFVPVQERRRAAVTQKRGLDCLLACQVSVNGRPTIWAQQYDMLTLKPDAARNYEMPSLASGESAGVMLFLMQLPDPNPQMIAAVHNAAAWFKKNEIHDRAFKSNGGDGRHLITAPGNGPIWARYYEIGTDRPVFGDRDKTIHDSVDEISKERRNGYAWYGDSAKRALAHYSKWAKNHPQKESK
jgi:PelA/Pel-15E family pectate lyase